MRSESRGRGTEKQPTGRGPEGCDENGPAAVPRLRDRLRIALDMRPPRALPAAHFDRNERHAYFGDRTLPLHTGRNSENARTGSYVDTSALLFTAE